MTNSRQILKHLDEHILLADGAMGTMIQQADLSIDDFQGHEGCNEVLNATRPEVIEEIHLQYFEAGSDAVETNSFGCNYANLFEYQLEAEIYNYSLKSSAIARKAADQFSEQKYVLGSIGPGTKLPSLGHTDFSTLNEAYFKNALGLLEGGADCLLIETAQDLLQAKSAIIGAQEALNHLNSNVPIIASFTVEQSGTLLLGTEVPAAITSLVSLGISGIGMNCATGPEEMSEHLRAINNLVSIPISCMPNAGLPVLMNGNAFYPLEAQPFAEYMARFVNEYGISIIGGCCGTTPEHIKSLRKLNLERKLRVKNDHETHVSSLYQAISIKQDSTYLNVGERGNANGSKAFRTALLADNYDECVEIAVSQVRTGAHVIDICVDYVGRDGVKDMLEIAARLATSSTLPVMLDSTEPAVIQAGLEKLGGRSLVNSLNFEDGDSESSRFSKMLQLVKKHGAAVVALVIDEEGQARNSNWKVRIADRLVTRLRKEGISDDAILVDMLTFPIATGQEETRKDGIETLNAIRDLKKKFPKVRTILGLSNISFGLNPAARQALNSVFLQEAVQVGLDAAIVDSGKILPLNQIPDENQIHLRNLIYDRREFDEQGTVTYDPLTAILEIYSSVNMSINSTTILDSLNDISIEENLRLRIVQGIGKKLENDLDKALEKYSALEIVNDHLLPGMKEVGDLFGAGVMQLPFVLQSAEVMKSSVNYLENFMEKTGKSGKGKVLLATVKGDVHDIGKNLVDIILTNNGYTVINIGIKQTIQQIIDAAEEHQVDIIGMSGLLVKSTVIMRENLEELNSRGLSSKYPIILGGAALTRSYVEDDLASIYGGVVRYAKDAFEGLSLVEKIMELKRTGVDNLPPVKQRIHARVDVKEIEQKEERSNVSLTNLVPSPPFFGTKVVKGISLLEVAKWLDERATFVGQWGLKPGRNSDMDLAELIEIEGRPRLRYWLDQIQRHSLNEMSVIYGYFPAYSNGNQILILDEPDGKEIETFSFPRQRTGEELCLADYVKPLGHPDNDFVAFHLVTMGSAISRFTANLFEANHYRDYLELHGLSVQLTEALAEMWHARIRAELKIDYEDADTLPEILKQSYRGERYSFGYPACPDLSLQVPLLRLLKPERIGVSLSEEFQLHPEQSTSAIIFHHPEARYFNAR